MTENTTVKKKSALACTGLYYKNASRVYLQNFWKFLVVGLIAAIVVNLVNLLVTSYFDGDLKLPLPSTHLAGYLLYLVIRLLIAMVINGFYGAILGMGFDIMGSGDEFAQISNFFYYVKKYWLKYFFLGFIVNILVYLLPFIDFLNPTPDFVIKMNYLVHSLQTVVYVFFYVLNPALMCYPTLSEALKNTVKIFKKYFLQILFSYLIYYFLFFFPLMVVKFVNLEILSVMQENETVWYIGKFFNQPFLVYHWDLTAFSRNFSRVFWFWRFILGFPFLCLVSLRINNEYQYNENPECFQ